MIFELSTIWPINNVKQHRVDSGLKDCLEPNNFSAYFEITAINV